MKRNVLGAILIVALAVPGTAQLIGGGSGGGGSTSSGSGSHSSHNTEFAPMLEELSLTGGPRSNEPVMIHRVVRNFETAHFTCAWLMTDANAGSPCLRSAQFAILKVVNAHLEFQELDLHECHNIVLHSIVMDESGNEVDSTETPGVVNAIGEITFAHSRYPRLMRGYSVLSVLDLELIPAENTPVRMHKTLAPTVNLLDTTAVYARDGKLSIKNGIHWKMPTVLPTHALEMAEVGAPQVNQFWLINGSFTTLLNIENVETVLPAGAFDLLIGEGAVRAEGTGGLWQIAEKCSSATGTAIDDLTVIVRGDEILPATRIDRGAGAALWLCDASGLSFSGAEETPIEIWVNVNAAPPSGTTLLHIQNVEVGNYSPELALLFPQRFIAGPEIPFSGLSNFETNPSGIVGLSFSH